MRKRKIYKNKRGYQFFYEGNKRVYIHIRVAEKKYGGKVYKGCVVHHKDGNKSNNKPSNLIIMKRSQHSGLHKRKKIN